MQPVRWRCLWPLLRTHVFKKPFFNTGPMERHPMFETWLLKLIKWVVFRTWWKITLSVFHNISASLFIFIEGAYHMTMFQFIFSVLVMLAAVPTVSCATQLTCYRCTYATFTYSGHRSESVDACNDPINSTALQSRPADYTCTANFGCLKEYVYFSADGNIAPVNWSLIILCVSKKSNYF